MSPAFWIGLVVLVAAGAVAIAGAETGRRRWLVVGKPIATTALFLVAGVPDGAFGWLIAAGLLLSLAGDVALLGESDARFLAGAGLFFVAHLCYAAAFLRVAGPAAGFAWGAPAALASVLLVAALWRGLGPLRGPVIAYAAALSATVVCGLGTRGGSLPPAAVLAACLGPVSFYVGDAVLAWNRFNPFGRPVRHPAYFTLGAYWLGQLGIALSARIAAG